MPEQTIALAQNSGVAIGNATIPSEGPKCIPLRLDFTVNTLYRVDPLALYMQQSLSLIQGVWADNSASATPLTISVSSTRQSIIVQPGEQGFYPVLSPKSGDIQFFSAGGEVLTCTLYNVPLPMGQWGPNPEAGNRYVEGGALSTQDQGLAQIIDPVKGLKVQDSGSGVNSFTPYLLQTYAGNGAEDPAPVLDFTVPNGQDGYITRAEIFITPDAFNNGGNSVSKVQISARGRRGIFYVSTDLFIPGAAPPNPQTGNIKVLDFTGPTKMFSFNQSVIGYSVYVDKPLTAGIYTINIFGFTKPI